MKVGVCEVKMLYHRDAAQVRVKLKMIESGTDRKSGRNQTQVVWSCECHVTVM